MGQQLASAQKNSREAWQHAYKVAAIPTKTCSASMWLATRLFITKLFSKINLVTSFCVGLTCQQTNIDFAF
jgi:hypothetical protein